MLESERLIIEPYNSNDFVDLFEMISDKDLTYPAGFRPVPDLETTKLSLQYRVASKQYVKIMLKDRQMIGEINFYKDTSKRNPNAYEIGFILKKDFHHKGYMQEALKVFIPWFFKNVDIDILSTHIFTDNESSENTLKALNFHYDGTIRRYKKMYDGKILDCKEYTLTREEIERNIKIWKQKF